MPESTLTRRTFLKAAAVTGMAATLFPSGTFALKGLAERPSAPTEAGEEQVLVLRCYECHRQCGMLVHVQDGQVLKVEGDPKLFNRGALCAKGQSTILSLHHPERINYPFKRTRPKGEADPGWVRISWDEALSITANKIKEIKEKHGARSIAVGQGTGRYSNEYSARLKNSIGTPNSIGPNHVCRGPMAAMANMTIGHNTRADFDRSKCYLFWGRNEVWAHGGAAAPGIMTNIENGSKLLVIDPRFEHPLASKADVYLPVRPGSDGALILSWIHVIIAEKLYNEEFVTKWTNGPFLVQTDTMELVREADIVPGGDDKPILAYPDSIADRSKRPTFMVWDAVTNSAKAADAPGVKPALLGTFTIGGKSYKPVFQLLADAAAEYPPEKAAEICWSGPVDKIKQAARIYAQAPNACSDIGSFGFQGLEGGHTNTFQTIRALACLSAITGNVNRVGGDVGLPDAAWIAGTWKREGGPRSMTAWGAPDDRWEVIMEGPHSTEPAMNEFPLQPGLPCMSDCFKAMATGSPYPIKAYIMIQGNPLGGWSEDQKATYEGLKALEFLADADLWVTPTGNLADVLFPAGLGPFERGRKPAIKPLFERWGDEGIYVELGRRIDPKWWPWQSEAEMWAWREEQEAEIKKRPVVPQDYFAQPDPKTGKPIGFPTPTGKVELYCVIAKQHGIPPIPNYVEPAQSPYSTPDLAKQFPLVLTTGARLPVYYHSALRNNPWQRELYPHPEIDINDETAAKLGIAQGDWVWIETKTGKIRMKARVTPGMDPRVVSTVHGWWQGCKELGLPGYGWDGANANILIAGDEHDPAVGVPPARSQLCKIYKADEPPFVWDPPYYGTTISEKDRGPRQFPEQPRKEGK